MILELIKFLIDSFSFDSKKGLFKNFRRNPYDKYKGPYPLNLNSNYRYLIVVKELQQKENINDTSNMEPYAIKSETLKGFGKLKWLD